MAPAGGALLAAGAGAPCPSARRSPRRGARVELRAERDEVTVGLAALDEPVAEAAVSLRLEVLGRDLGQSCTSAGWATHAASASRSSRSAIASSFGESPRRASSRRPSASGPERLLGQVEPSREQSERVLPLRRVLGRCRISRARTNASWRSGARSSSSRTRWTT